ncbi:MAG TPA: alpha-glucuronidase family glycosyl hydrolase [Acidobacteriaceae bacterium]
MLICGSAFSYATAQTVQQRSVDSQAAWLIYSPVKSELVFPGKRHIPETIITLGDSTLQQTAAHELVLGWQGMLQHTPRVAAAQFSGEDAVLIGTVEQLRRREPSLGTALAASVSTLPGSFTLRSVRHPHHTDIIIAGSDDRGVLYGTFALLRIIAQQKPLEHLNDVESPSATVRWTNEWDNFDGSIERGYAGRSIFFDHNTVRRDLAPVTRYARLLASVGINGCTISNVNADPRLLQTENLQQIARIAAAFRPYGVRVSLSIDMSSPKRIGGLQTFDPLNSEVIAWWQKKVDEIYNLIPDFGGVVIKADSEGQPGPSQYGRTSSDAANLLARALKPHGGIVMYRGFVYNHHLDWQDPKADRARAGYDNFHSLDGKFDDNVVVQIKYGPIDFQIREPVSPLFAGLPHTNEAIEVEVSQEYTGQQRHLVYLVPMWKESLDTDLHASSTRSSRVRDVITGRTFGQTTTGFVAVTNVGLDDYWLGHPLAMANLYGFGRLAWNPELDAETISDEWTRLTFGNDARVRQVVNTLQMNSWRTYEDYTGPLGAGTLTDIIGIHYGPGIESAERNGWGQWIHADHVGIGMDRTVATGTGYIGQYPALLAATYESLQTCPDDLLLFFHHAAYTYRLHSGSTVIQHIYDTHYAGAAAAAAQVPAWESLAGKVPDRTYLEVLHRLQYQAGHAIVWRDAVVDWFHAMSGIPDDKGRVGHNPKRTEAEDMQLQGYAVTTVTPWETASGGKAIVCKGHASCSASMRFTGVDGRYDVAVQYFDLNSGVSHFQLKVNGAVRDQWLADDTLPSDHLDGHTSTRHTMARVALHNGDQIEITGEPAGQEPAPIDYLEITPSISSVKEKP